MSIKHSAFFFNYKSCKDEFQSLTEEINRGNIERLSLLVQSIRKSVGYPNQWILNNIGSSIGNIGLDQKDEYKNALVGHWFLIVLAQYLRPAKSLDYRWSRLFFVLRKLEWGEEEVKEAIFGNSIVKLIDTDFRANVQARILWSDPYWMWIRPERAIYNGWLSIDEICLINEKLQSVRKEILNRDKPFPEFWIKHRFTHTEFEELLSITFSNFEKAKHQSTGLYLIGHEED